MFSKSKLDRVLRKAQERGDQSAKRVIIRTKAGKAGGVAGLLAKHGDRVESNHRLVDAITVTLHGEDLLGLEQLIDVESMSTDAIVSGGSLLSGLQVSALGLTASLNTPAGYSEPCQSYTRPRQMTTIADTTSASR